MNFVLNYIGSDHLDVSAIRNFLHVNKIQVVDGSLLPHTALLELKETDVEKVRTLFKNGWTLSPLKSYKVPDTKRKIRK